MKQYSNSSSSKSPSPSESSRRNSLGASEQRVRSKYGIWGMDETPEFSNPSPEVDEAQDSESTHQFHRSVLFYYLIPVFGFFPSLWTLYRRQGNKEQMIVSRLSVTLALAWLLGHLLLESSVQITESMTLPLLLVSSLLTSSYFVVSVWLMIRIWQRRSLKIPAISHVAEEVVGRHL